MIHSLSNYYSYKVDLYFLSLSLTYTIPPNPISSKLKVNKKRHHRRTPDR